MVDLLKLMDERVLIVDGAMGTNLHCCQPTDADWGGKDFVNCTEWMLFTRPEWVRDVHRSFLAVGCDAIETNTFGANRIALGEFHQADAVEEVNRRAVRLAHEACAEFSSSAHPRFVFGSIGPGTKLVSV